MACLHLCGGRVGGGVVGGCGRCGVGCPVSADNYGVIAQHPLTQRWHVLMGFASDDDFTPRVSDAGYANRDEALSVANDEAIGGGFEYGYRIEGWPGVWYEYCDACGDFGERYLDGAVVRDARGREVTR